MTEEAHVAIDCIKKFLKQSNMSKFLIVNINNVEDYMNIKSSLDIELSTIKLSNFCCEYDDMPDIEKFVKCCRETDKSSLVLGVSQYLKLKNKESFEMWTQVLLSSMNTLAKVIMIYFDCENKLKEILDRDVRFKNQNQIILVKGDRLENATLNLVNSQITNKKNGNVINGIKNYLDQCEEECIVKLPVSTRHYNYDYSEAGVNIRKISDSFQLLNLFKEIPGEITSDLGTEDNWKYLYENMHEYCLKDLLIREFGNMDNIDLLFYNWSKWDDNIKWLYFIALKLSEIKNKYLDYVVKKSLKNTDFIRNLYFSILDFSYEDDEFESLYNQRKNLIEVIGNDSCINEFCSIVNMKAEDRIYYLTNITSLERECIFSWLSELDYIDDNSRAIISKVYPELESYMMEYNIGIEPYNDYFKKYKLQKLNNKIYNGFIDVVYENAKRRDYNLFLKTRNEVFEKIDKRGSKIYFVDSLGVEYMGYIGKICTEMGLSIDVSFTTANLPTTTFSNKDFLEGFWDITNDIKDLDDIKHEGKGDYNYEFSKLPLHIHEELNIIKEIFRKIKAELSKPDVKKVIVVSDHGASRLVVLYGNKITYPTETNGTQGGRCCKYVEGMEVPLYATIENDQCILASYDRFKTPGAPRVETHGGATLEELIVPVIVVKNEKEIIRANLVEDVITVSYKIKAVLKIFVTKKFEKIKVKLNNNEYESTEFDGRYYTVPIYDIIKLGEYEGEVYANEQYIDKIKFNVIKPTSNEKDYGI
ncbi:MAG: BREX-4 system phosphatase PglZ [Peptoclostridium sp.]|uniref:BREX-4 system phosphatase PglZ n=1 Tax=Peptoclostridium sp. TaxID=1904860 RepID=UPI00139C7351|nr:BREX-4 system phosphatase PglZ [Peptoclostridium sp.]MZQ76087.1 BREX-4 system phosphatase PglZ [Peptoclostridium sp.]